MRYLALLCAGLAVLPLHTQGAATVPVLTPSQPAVAAGQSITITSSVPVTWSLRGAGSLGNSSGNSVTYTAPASVVAQTAILGCPVSPGDSVFNTRADALPENPSSATWIAHMSSVPITISPAWGVTYADSQTPLASWKPYYGNNNNDYSTVYSFPFPGRGPTLKRENGNYVGVSGYVNINDHHTVTVRRSDCEFFETYNDRIGAETFPCKDLLTGGCNISSLNVPYGFGSITPGNGPYAMPYGSTDAAGLPLAPLSWHLDEVKAGAIRHAIRFTSSIGYINGAIWPATTANALSPFAPPYGARFLLKTRARGGPDVNSVCLQSTGVVNTDCVTMLSALQQYGMMLADIGLNNEMQAFTDLTEDATTRAALKLIADARIPITSFYAVDESSLRQTAANNFAAYANGSYSVDPNNRYVTPVNSAVITATPVMGTPISVPVALQGTAVGLLSNQLTIAAGLAGYQIKSWVNPPAADQSVSWSLVSGVGSVTADGAYSAPSSITGGDTAVLKVTAAADPKAVNYVYVKVLSTSNAPAAGTIRIDSGSETATQDTNGILWNAESGMEASVPTFSSPDYPVWPGMEGVQYGTELYTRGGDIAYRLAVPNGNYKVRVLYGQIYNGDYPNKTFSQSFVTSPVMVEAQGAIGAHNYDWNLAAGFHYQTAADIYVPARVVDNNLSIRAMVSTPDTAITQVSGLAPLYSGKFPFLLTGSSIKSSSINGIVIIPDATAPHWTIDAQGATAIAAGQNLQLYNIDWYTGLNDPLWTIVSGPNGASISATGLLSVAATALTNSQPLIVMASDGRFSATATFQTPASAAPPAPNPPAAAPPAPRSAEPVSTSAFDYVRQVTIAHAQAGSTAQLNFPVTVSLTDAGLRGILLGGHVKSTAGFDIVLASDAAGKNLLAWEVEQYDALRGQWTADVRIPSLSSTQDTTFYLLYGNSAITTSQANAAGVWDSNYQAVYHFASLTALLKDSTKGAHEGKALGWGFSAAGEIGGAALVTGGSANLPIDSLLNSNTGSIELWVNSSSPQDSLHNASLFQRDWFNGSPDGFYLGWSGYFNDFEADWKIGGQIAKFAVPAASIPMRPNTWNQVTYTWDRANHAQTLSLNGQRVALNTQVFGNPTFTTPLSFSVPYNPSYYGISGLLDEARFSTVVRSADWIKASFNSQRPNSTFITVAAELSTSQAAKPTAPGTSGANSKPAQNALRAIRKVLVFAWRVIKAGVTHLV